MKDILILAGYLPLVGLLAFLYFRYIRVHLKKQPAEYPRQQIAIPNANRILEDSGVSFKESDMEDLKDRLIRVLEQEKLYLNPDIRVGDLSERLQVSKSYLAQTIKIKLNKNFCQLVHYYRVREAMRLFSLNPDLSISQLCRKVGFNSMTTFNTAFGRNTGFTPAEWCKEYRKRNEAKT